MAAWPRALLLVVSAFVALQQLHAEQKLETGHFPFADIEVLYQMYDSAKPDAPVVVFLHGEKFTSDHWVDQGTMKLLNRGGYRTLSVDLPAFGKTRHLPYLDNNMRAEFVKATLEFAAKGGNITQAGAVLVTPSMSGQWAIPFLDRYGIMLKGWAALSPSGVSKWGGPWEDTHRKVKLLAVYGDKDEKKVQADNLLKLFSRSRKVVVPDAEESHYLDQPDVFHKHLHYFVKECFDPPNPTT